MGFLQVSIYLIIIGFYSSKITATQVEKNIGIYCSNDFYFENRMNKICKWIFDNGTSFKDTYQSAQQDCPNNHVLATFNKEIREHKLSLSSCQGIIEIWINEDSIGNNNSLRINNGGQVEMINKSSSESLEYFLCIDKNQTITCESDEYCTLTERQFCSQIHNKCIQCPSSWTLNSGYCYYYNNNSNNWIDANLWCAIHGGLLLSILNITEYNYFKNIYNGKEFWIGLKRNTTSSLWHWLSNNLVFNDNLSWWRQSEPQSYENCARIHSNFKIKI
jgi:hypothetical protein